MGTDPTSFGSPTSPDPGPVDSPTPTSTPTHEPTLAHTARRGTRKLFENAVKLFELVRDTRPPPDQQALRLSTVERNIILPVKALLIGLVAWHLFSPEANVVDRTAIDGRPSPLSTSSTSPSSPPTPSTLANPATPDSPTPSLTTDSSASTLFKPQSLSTNNRTLRASSTNLISSNAPSEIPLIQVTSPAHPQSQEQLELTTQTLSQGFKAVRLILLAYVLVNIPVAFLLLWPKFLKLRLRHVQSLIFSISSIDSLFVAALTYLTEGFGSILFWLFPGLIVRNSISLPLTRPQLILNLSAVLLYTAAGSLDLVNAFVPSNSDEMLPPVGAFTPPTLNNPTEPFLLRIFLLLLLTLCCYAIQALLEKQRQTETDARELTARQQQLDVAARLAAQIAHQLKNPLGIINTTAYNLERNLRVGRKDAADHQIEMIREEVNRADQIITRLMGYAQLKEGKIEKLDVIEELERAVRDAFPVAAKFNITIERQFARDLPPLWMQRQHLADIFSNILVNAREAMFGQGVIRLSAQPLPEGGIVLKLADSGPGIPPERINQIFQPYFTTKEKGSGLGLAIVKQNMNLYGGAVQVTSELGKGATFTLSFPVRSRTSWTP